MIRLLEAQERFILRDGYRGCGKMWTRFMSSMGFQHLSGLYGQYSRTPDEIDRYRVALNRYGIAAILQINHFPEPPPIDPSRVVQPAVRIQIKKP